MKKRVLTCVTTLVLAVIFISSLIGCPFAAGPPEPTPPPPPAPEPSTAPAPTPEPEPPPPPIKNQEPEPPEPEPVDYPPEIAECKMPESGCPVGEIPFAIKAVGFNFKGQQTLNVLGSIQIEADSPPEIVKIRTYGEVLIFTDFPISVVAVDDIGIAGVRIDFERNGISTGGIELEEIEEGLFKSFYRFNALGTFDYTITVTDTSGQTDIRTGQIVVTIWHLAGILLSPPPPPPPPEPGPD